MLRSFVLIASALALCFTLSACGQKGPLYLPQPDAAPASEPTEAKQP